MCLYSIRSQFENLRDSGKPYNYTFYAYKVIGKNLRSVVMQHQGWIPGAGAVEQKPQVHPKSKNSFIIDRGIHAFRNFKSAQTEQSRHEYPLTTPKTTVIIKVKISYSDVTGASESQCAARRVSWDGTYYDQKSQRWKKLKLKPNW